MGRPRILKDKPCRGCGKLFRPPAKKINNCSMACSRKNLPKKGVFKKCKLCGVKTYRRKCHAKFNKSFCSRKHMIEFMKEKAFRFSCVICSKVVLTQPAQMTLRHRKTCSIACRGKFARLEALKRRVEQGYTKHQIDRILRYSVDAKRWRESVFKRDDWTCQVCKVRGGQRLEADHIKPWAYYPELRFELSNGRTLCRPCHDKTKMSAKRMREVYGKAENIITAS